jgi:CHAT domain-containing protein
MTHRRLRQRVFACFVLAALTCPALFGAQQSSPERDAIEALFKQAFEAQAAGRNTELESLGRTALVQAQAAGLQDLQVRAMLTIAQALFIQSRLAESLAITREAEPIATGLEDRIHRARVWNQIALNLRELGEIEEASDYFWRGLDVQRALGNRLEQARVLRNLSMVYNMLGDLIRAEELAREALAEATAAGDGLWQQLSLATIAIHQAWQGREEEALATFRRAQAMQPAVRSAAVDGEILANIAYTEFLGGDYQASRSTARAALDLNKEYPQARALMGSVLGQSELKLGQPRVAVEILTDATAQWRALGVTAHPHHALGSEVWLVRALRAIGEESRAADLNGRVIRDFEHIFGRVALDEGTRATARAAMSASYVEGIDMLVARGRLDDAFDLSERYRARAFVESMAEWRGGAAVTLGEADRLREQALGGQLSDVQRSLWDLAVGDPRRLPLEASLRRLEQERDAFRREIRQKNPRLAAVRYPAVRTAAELQKAGEPGTVTLAFVLGDERSFVWAISERGLSAGLLPARDRIEQAVNRFTTALMARPGLDRERSLRTVRAEARGLYKLLLSPVESTVQSATRLVVIPDGVLHHLPFEALEQPNGTYLVERLSVSVAASATALAALEADDAPAAGASLLAFADPVFAGAAQKTSERRAGSRRELTALPFTQSEARAIASALPGKNRVHIGAAATEAALKSEPLASYRYLHFATHAYTDDVRPGRSAIVLSVGADKLEDGLLQPAEIMSLRLNADLVTLSACGTGLGRLHKGEGIVGLSRAFFYAGARSVTASLWNVNDAATASLMRQFYQGLAKGLRKDDALRAAKLRMIRSGDAAHAHPYYWAPFVLLGSAS